MLVFIQNSPVLIKNSCEFTWDGLFVTLCIFSPTIPRRTDQLKIFYVTCTTQTYFVIYIITNIIYELSVKPSSASICM